MAGLPEEVTMKGSVIEAGADVVVTTEMARAIDSRDAMEERARAWREGAVSLPIRPVRRRFQDAVAASHMLPGRDSEEADLAPGPQRASAHRAIHGWAEPYAERLAAALHCVGEHEASRHEPVWRAFMQERVPVRPTREVGARAMWRIFACLACAALVALFGAQPRVSGTIADIAAPRANAALIVEVASGAEPPTTRLQHALHGFEEPVLKVLPTEVRQGSLVVDVGSQGAAVAQAQFAGRSQVAEPVVRTVYEMPRLVKEPERVLRKRPGADPVRIAQVSPPVAEEDGAVIDEGRPLYFEPQSSEPTNVEAKPLPAAESTPPSPPKSEAKGTAPADSFSRKYPKKGAARGAKSKTASAGKAAGAAEGAATRRWRDDRSVQDVQVSRCTSVEVRANEIFDLFSGLFGGASKECAGAEQYIALPDEPYVSVNDIIMTALKHYP